MEQIKSQKLRLCVVDSSGNRTEITCDSVRLCAKDDAKGKGGGSLGIRQGHLPALIALGRGTVIATADDGSVLLKYPVDGGIASVSQNMVTVLP